MTIEETLWRQAKSSRAWRHGDQYRKFRWMHQRSKRTVGSILAVQGKEIQMTEEIVYRIALALAALALGWVLGRMYPYD